MNLIIVLTHRHTQRGGCCLALLHPREIIGVQCLAHLNRWSVEFRQPTNWATAIPVYNLKQANQPRGARREHIQEVFGVSHPPEVVHVVVLEGAGGRRRGWQRVLRRLRPLQDVPSAQAQAQLSAQFRVVDGGQLVGAQQALAHVTQRDVDGHRGRAAELGADWMTEILRPHREGEEEKFDEQKLPKKIPT